MTQIRQPILIIHANVEWGTVAETKSEQFDVMRASQDASDGVLVTFLGTHVNVKFFSPTTEVYDEASKVEQNCIRAQVDMDKKFMEMS